MGFLDDYAVVNPRTEASMTNPDTPKCVNLSDYFEVVRRIDQLEIQTKKLHARLTALENMERAIKGDDFMDRFYS